MDRLTRYLITNYSVFMTVSEHAAYRAIVLEEKATRSSTAEARDKLDRAAELSDPVVRALLAGGPDAFFNQLRDRLMSERQTEIVLNLCPKCGALARTPQALQCPDCHHAWHDSVP